MKVFADVDKKILRIIENERSIFRGEKSADELKIYINREILVNEYPTITALLSNGRKIGAYTADSYENEEINGESCVVASFTLSKENGFTLSEGKMQITIWFNQGNKKEAIGNLIVEVVNTTAYDDGDVIISGDVNETIVNLKVEMESLQQSIPNVYVKKAGDNITGAINSSIKNGASLIGDTQLEIKAKETTGDIGNFKVYNKFSYDYGKAFKTAEISAKSNNGLNAHKIRVNELGASYVVETNGVENEKLFALKEEVGVINLGYITESPQSATNYILNSIKTCGAYNFTYVGRNYLMLVTTDQDGEISQTILIENAYVDGLSQIIRIYNTRENNWIIKIRLLTTQEYVDNKINTLINDSPEALDTLKELANALGNDENFATNVLNKINEKVNKTYVDEKLGDIQTLLEAI